MIFTILSLSKHNSHGYSFKKHKCTTIVFATFTRSRKSGVRYWLDGLVAAEDSDGQPYTIENHFSSVYRYDKDKGRCVLRFGGNFLSSTEAFFKKNEEGELEVVHPDIITFKCIEK